MRSVQTLRSSPPTKMALEALIFCIGGEGEIRTLDQVSPMPVFETGAFDHSATSPGVSDETDR